MNAARHENSIRWNFMKCSFCRTTIGQPRGPSEDGVSDSEESPEDGRLPALSCTGLLGWLVMAVVVVILGKRDFLGMPSAPLDRLLHDVIYLGAYRL